MKNRITIWTFWAWAKVRGSKWKCKLAYAGAIIPGMSNLQRVWSHHLHILSLLVPKVVFFFILTHIFSFSAFLGTTPKFLVKIKFLFKIGLTQAWRKAKSPPNHEHYTPGHILAVSYIWYLRTWGCPFSECSNFVHFCPNFLICSF